MRNKFLTAILCLGLLTAFFACEKDGNPEETESSTEIQDIISRRLSLEGAPHFTKVNSKINKLRNKLNTKGEVLQKSLSIDSVTILTDEILYMTYAQTHTYTFKLLRMNPQYYIENIVLHYNVDTESYDEYLVQYDISEQEFLDIYNGSYIGEESRALITNLDSGTVAEIMSKSDCQRTCQTIYVNCTAGGNHAPGQLCQGNIDQQPYTYESCTTTCVDQEDTSIDPGPSGSGGGGGSSSVNTNPEPNEPCENTMNGQNEVGITDDEGNCVAVDDDDESLPEPTDPCEELNKLTDNFGTKNALIDLSQNTDQTNEKGYAIKRDQSTGNYEAPEATVVSTVSANGANANIPMQNYLGNNYIGILHTHPRASDGWIPMFSTGDINVLFYLALKHNSNGSAKNYADYMITLTVPEGTYAIKIKDWLKFSLARNSKWNDTNTEFGIFKTLNDKYKYRDPQGDIKFVEKDILDLFKEFDMGIGLYKANDDLTSWSELVHDLNPLSPNFGYAKEIPCQEI